MSGVQLSLRARRRWIAARRAEEQRWRDLSGPVVIVRGPVEHLEPADR